MWVTRCTPLNWKYRSYQKHWPLWHPTETCHFLASRSWEPAQIWYIQAQWFNEFAFSLNSVSHLTSFQNIPLCFIYLQLTEPEQNLLWQPNDPWCNMVPRSFRYCNIRANILMKMAHFIYLGTCKYISISLFSF